MENPSIPSSPTSPKEQFQPGLSQPGASSPKTSADQSKMKEVDQSPSTADNSPVLIGSSEASGSKNPDVPNQEQQEQRYRVYTSLRAIVNEVASQLRKRSDEVLNPDPISYRLPENNEGINASNIAAQSNPSSSAEVKTRAKSTLVGEEIVSFALPPDCQMGRDTDKNDQQLSLFEERFQGWRIECRRRANGKLDLFYRHGHSSRMFRSTVEVVDFIMDAFIAKETSGNTSVQVPIQEQGPASAARGLLKRKTPSRGRGEISASNLFKISRAEKFPSAQSETSRSVHNTTVEKANLETEVKRFLEESYGNLLNSFCSGSVPQGSEHESEESSKSGSEKNEDVVSDEETPTAAKSASGEGRFD